MSTAPRLERFAELTGHSKEDCAENEDQRGDNAVNEGDSEDEQHLRVHPAIVDAWRGVDLGVIAGCLGTEVARWRPNVAPSEVEERPDVQDRQRHQAKAVQHDIGDHEVAGLRCPKSNRKLLCDLGWVVCQIPHKLPVGGGDQEDEENSHEKVEIVSWS